MLLDNVLVSFPVNRPGSPSISDRSREARPAAVETAQPKLSVCAKCAWATPIPKGRLSDIAVSELHRAFEVHDCGAYPKQEKSPEVAGHDLKVGAARRPTETALPKTSSKLMKMLAQRALHSYLPRTVE